MTEPIFNIICFQWGWWPRKNAAVSGREYVYRLARAVERHTTRPHRFVCFTDRPGQDQENVDFRLIPKPVLAWRRNLTKAYMFSKAAELDGPALCLDLDVVIVGSIDPLLDAVANEQRLITCNGAFQKERIGGSVIGFQPDNKWTRSLYAPLLMPERNTVIVGKTKGSERRYFRKTLNHADVAFWKDVIPGKAVVDSYKKDHRSNHTGFQNTRIIRFHGKPRPHQVEAKWLTDNWR